MNFSIVLAILAFFALNSQNNSHKKFGNIADFSCLLSDDTKSFINCIGTLTSHSCSGDEKLAALLQIASNPALLEMLKKFATASNATQNDTKPPNTEEQTSCEEFFRPIENIADDNVKSKLYDLYNNWYIK